MYNAQYQHTHDIDWFFMNGDMPVHVASNGGSLPNKMYKALDLQNLQTMVEAMKPVCRFTINERALETYARQNYLNENGEGIKLVDVPKEIEQLGFLGNTPAWIKAYSWSFIKMAQRGFYSFDRDVRTGKYFLVARPVVRPEISEDILTMMFHLPKDRALIIGEDVLTQTEQYRFVGPIERYIRDRDCR